MRLHLLVPFWALILLGCTFDLEPPCDSSTDDCSIDAKTQEVVYGTDDRKEYSDPGVSSAERNWADSVALIATRDAAYSAVTCSGATCSVPQGLVFAYDEARNRDVSGLCAGEKFGPTASLPQGQHTADGGFGSGFLVARDILATAAHVVEPGNISGVYNSCDQLAIVFGYTASVGGDGPSQIPATDVYSCSDVLLHNANKDVALIRLDRTVTGRSRLPFRRVGKVASAAKLALIGHPDRLPLKVSRGGAVKQNTAANFFSTTVDAFHGNSGGPVFNRETGLVEGLVSAGNDDYTFNYSNGLSAGCLEVNVCSSLGCSGNPYETDARATSWASKVPDQSPRAFSTMALTVDEVYTHVVAGDFDGDGRHDVFLFGGDEKNDKILYGKFNKSTESVVVTVPDNYGVPFVGDFDGDKRSDIFWYRSGAGQDRIWWGQATRANFGTVSTNMREDGSGYSPFLADFDGNGGTDIFWYGRGASAPGEKIWWSNENRNGQPSTGTGTFTSQGYAITGTAYYPVTGDFDANGRSEIFWFEPGVTSGSVWSLSSSKAITSSSQSIPSAIGTSHRPYAGDYDGNGATDIFYYASGAISEVVWWYRIDTKGTFRSTTLTVNSSYKPAVGDFNGDSAADMFWYGSGTNGDYRHWGKP